MKPRMIELLDNRPDVKQLKGTTETDLEGTVDQKEKQIVLHEEQKVFRTIQKVSNLNYGELSN